MSTGEGQREREGGPPALFRLNQDEDISDEWSKAQTQTSFSPGSAVHV